MELEPPYSWTMVDVECHHCLWNTHTNGLCRAWHAIITLGQQIRSDEIGHGIPSLPFNNIHGKTM